MGNIKFNISKDAKDIIDMLKVSLGIDETPTIVKMCLAKGISVMDPSEKLEKFSGNGNWLVPENIIKDREYLLFKHLIINEHKTVINDKEINEYFAFYIEKGARQIKNQLDNKTAFDDIRILLLS